jgi:hypothetical protein
MDGWDHHGDIRGALPKSCAASDLPCAGLIRDLKSRGLMEDTLVVCSGEFGRTPWSQDLSRTAPIEKHGREHQPESFCAWLACGDVRSGLMHGETDAASAPSPTRSTFTTSTPPFCTCSASITSVSLGATLAVIFASPMSTVRWCGRYWCERQVALPGRCLRRAGMTCLLPVDSGKCSATQASNPQSVQGGTPPACTGLRRQQYTLKSSGAEKNARLVLRSWGKRDFGHSLFRPAQAPWSGKMCSPRLS